jgi:hypothetical protein
MVITRHTLFHTNLGSARGAKRRDKTHDVIVKFLLGKICNYFFDYSNYMYKRQTE